jgi:Xaa-Pro dipeptidase
MHTVSEQEMLAILWGNLHLDYTDDAIIKSIEKMIRVKGLQITEADLISTICSYCSHFRIRSPVILEGVAQYFLEHGARLEPAQVCALSLTFGTLDFHPANGFKFWELLEHYLEHNFIKFAPLDMINMLVSFIYLERYPLNFTNKIFNPFFMERLHGQPEEVGPPPQPPAPQLVAVSREELKLFDSAMTLACPAYQGPFLPKNTNYKPMRQVGSKEFHHW